jgi:hypothetical protein
MKNWGVLPLILCLALLRPVLTEAQSNGANQTVKFGTVNTVPRPNCDVNCDEPGYVNWGTNTNYSATYQLFGITPVPGFNFSPPYGAGPPNYVAPGSGFSCTVQFDPASPGTYSGTIVVDYINIHTNQHLYLTISVSGTYAP